APHRPGLDPAAARPDHLAARTLARTADRKTDIAPPVSPAADRLAEDHVVEHGGVDVGMRDRLPTGDLSEIPGMNRRKRPPRLSDGRPDGRDDDRVVLHARDYRPSPRPRQNWSKRIIDLNPRSL